MTAGNGYTVTVRSLVDNPTNLHLIKDVKYVLLIC